MAELTPIQKEIEARNIELGRKLLAYEVMRQALTNILFTINSHRGPSSYALEKIAEIARDAIAKAENKP